jgi:hypothetical protein
MRHGMERRSARSHRVNNMRRTVDVGARRRHYHDRHHPAGYMEELEREFSSVQPLGRKGQIAADWSPEPRLLKAAAALQTLLVPNTSLSF